MAGRVANLVSAQRQLLRDISHELRSPLARLSIALNLAGRSAPVEIEKNLERARLEIDRMNNLIGQV